MYYHTGSAEAGDRVDLQREPMNEFDSNAIKIVESAGLRRIVGQLPKLPKDLVERLAEMIDEERLTLLYGIMPNGSGDGSFEEGQMKIIVHCII